MKHKIQIRILALIFFLSPTTAFSCEEWTPQTPFPQGNTLYDIWGSSGMDVFAIGASGTVIRYNGTNWSIMNSNTTNQLNGVWGSSSTNVFAVGAGGTILHFNGTNWSTMSGGTLNTLNGVWGSSSTDVFAVGAGGMILHCTDLILTFSISGTVSGAVKSEVTMTLSGDSSDTTKTDASGNYSFIDLSNGTYTVTPSKTGYTFVPASETVTISGKDVTKVNFTSSAATHSISGTVTGDVKFGVIVTLSGSGSGSKVTNFLGDYSFTDLSNGTYTVTPSKTDYTFTPTSKTVTISGADKTGVDFIASAVTTTCSTWDDVIAEYNAYVAGQVTWDKVITCYNQYIASHP